jgi:NitT/TauT family transport system substrate-binding protein
MLRPSKGIRAVAPDLDGVGTASRIARPLLPRSRVLAMLAVTPAARALPAIAQISGPAKMRVGTIFVESGIEATYAQQIGAFKDAGLDVELVALPNGGTITAAVLSGTIDAGVSNAATIATAYARGLAIYLLVPSAIYSSASPSTVLAVAAGAPIRSAKDLNGKNVGVVTLNDLMQASVEKWIDQNGGDSHSVNFVEMPNASAAPALAARRIDASVIQEPVFSQVKTEVRVLGLPYDAIGKRILITAFSANKSWADANPAVAQRFARAMHATAAWANRNPNATATILADATKIPVAVITAMNRLTFATATDLSLLQPVIDTAAQYKVLPRGFPAAELVPAGLAAG